MKNYRKFFNNADDITFCLAVVGTYVGTLFGCYFGNYLCQNSKSEKQPIHIAAPKISYIKK